MSEQGDSQLQQAVYDLGIFLHTEMSSLRVDQDEEALTLSELLNFTPVEAVEYISEVTRELLEYRRGMSGSKSFDEFTNIQKFEKALQKLENEVRNHIKVEQQLRLHVESIQAKAAEEMKEKDDTIARYKQIVDQLKSEKGIRERRHAMLDFTETPGREERGPYTERRDEHTAAIHEVVQLRSSQRQECDRIIDLTRKLAKLEHQVHKYKAAYMAKDHECKDLTLRLAGLRSSSKHSPRPDTAETRSRKYAKKDQTVIERSTSREAETRSYTPVPSTLTATRVPSQQLLHSHSTERKRFRVKTPIRKHEAVVSRRS